MASECYVGNSPVWFDQSHQHCNKCNSGASSSFHSYGIRRGQCGWITCCVEARKLLNDIGSNEGEQELYTSLCCYEMIQLTVLPCLEWHDVICK